MQYWQRLIGEARTRILLCYTALTLGFVIVALPLMQQRVFSKVDERVREDLQEEVKSFQKLLKGNVSDTDRMILKRILEADRPPFTTRPKTERETETINVRPRLYLRFILGVKFQRMTHFCWRSLMENFISLALEPYRRRFKVTKL